MRQQNIYIPIIDERPETSLVKYADAIELRLRTWADIAKAADTARKFTRDKNGRRELVCP